MLINQEITLYHCIYCASCVAPQVNGTFVGLIMRFHIEVTGIQDPTFTQYWMGFMPLSKPFHLKMRQRYEAYQYEVKWYHVTRPKVVTKEFLQILERFQTYSSSLSVIVNLKAKEEREQTDLLMLFSSCFSQ